MTTHDKMLHLLAILKHIKADLKALAADNTYDPEADALLLQSALEISAILRTWRSEREILQEEPQYLDAEVTAQPEPKG